MPRRTHVLITAGNTREMIDPVRYLSNVSTGVMGFRLAQAARDAGYRVTLISGPTSLRPPQGVKYIPITSSEELARVLRNAFPDSDVLFMTSAVCDFRPARFSPRKIKRKTVFGLKLVSTPDILAGLARRKGKRMVIGFCLETERLLANAAQKLRAKRLDYIVANFLGKGSRPFGEHRTSVVVLGRKGERFAIKGASKKRVAHFLVEKLLGNL